MTQPPRPSRDDLEVALERARAEIRRLRRQNRDLVEELNWAEEQVRVLRRLVARLFNTAHHLL